jgi:diguanylate cyclase (GGDEF)-like protein
MTAPAIPANEPSRLYRLAQTELLDTAHEERFDRIVRVARRLFGVPIALVSLVDENRQWFKSCIGIDATETPRDVSFCGHAILSDQVFVIPDATADKRFAANPLVTGAPHIRFYAGYPLDAGNGMRVGTLCVIDTKPRQFDAADQETLRDLGKIVEREMQSTLLTTIDELTGLSNRRAFLARGQQVLDVCRRLKTPVGILFFDMNDFKQVNDTFGHAEGDVALRNFARLLEASFRSSDIIARLGGDEFAVILPSAPPEEIARIIARFDAALARFNRDSGRGYDLRTSIGSADAGIAEPSDLSQLLAEADQRMYADKRRRKSEAVPRISVVSSGMGATTGGTSPASTIPFKK